LVIHSPDDDVIPYTHGLKLFQAAHSPKKFLKITGKHLYGFVKSRDIYLDGFREFLREHIPGYPS
jgi:uncharacterized protein